MFTSLMAIRQEGREERRTRALKRFYLRDEVLVASPLRRLTTAQHTRQRGAMVHSGRGRERQRERERDMRELLTIDLQMTPKGKESSLTNCFIPRTHTTHARHTIEQKRWICTIIYFLRPFCFLSHKHSRCFKAVNQCLDFSRGALDEWPFWAAPSI
jgi:hypothetical protein